MDVWAADPLLASADGIAVLADGAVYVNTFGSGTLVKIGRGRGRHSGGAGEARHLAASHAARRYAQCRRHGHADD